MMNKKNLSKEQLKERVNKVENGIEGILNERIEVLTKKSEGLSNEESAELKAKKELLDKFLKVKNEVNQEESMLKLGSIEKAINEKKQKFEELAGKEGVSMEAVNKESLSLQSMVKAWREDVDKVNDVLFKEEMGKVREYNKQIDDRFSVYENIYKDFYDFVEIYQDEEDKKHYARYKEGKPKTTWMNESNHDEYLSILNGVRNAVFDQRGKETEKMDDIWKGLAKEYVKNQQQMVLKVPMVLEILRLPENKKLLADIEAFQEKIKKENKDALLEGAAKNYVELDIKGGKGKIDKAFGELDKALIDQITNKAKVRAENIAKALITLETEVGKWKEHNKSWRLINWFGFEWMGITQGAKEAKIEAIQDLKKDIGKIIGEENKNKKSVADANEYAKKIADFTKRAKALGIDTSGLDKDNKEEVQNEDVLAIEGFVGGILDKVIEKNPEYTGKTKDEKKVNKYEEIIENLKKEIEPLEKIKEKNDEETETLKAKKEVLEQMLKFKNEVEQNESMTKIKKVIDDIGSEKTAFEKLAATGDMYAVDKKALSLRVKIKGWKEDIEKVDSVLFADTMGEIQKYNENVDKHLSVYASIYKDVLEAYPKSPGEEEVSPGWMTKEEDKSKYLEILGDFSTAVATQRSKESEYIKEYNLTVDNKGIKKPESLGLQDIMALEDNKGLAEKIKTLQEKIKKENKKESLKKASEAYVGLELTGKKDKVNEDIEALDRVLTQKIDEKAKVRANRIAGALGELKNDVENWKERSAFWVGLPNLIGWEKFGVTKGVKDARRKAIEELMGEVNAVYKGKGDSKNFEEAEARKKAIAEFESKARKLGINTKFLNKTDEEMGEMKIEEDRKQAVKVQEKVVEELKKDIKKKEEEIKTKEKEVKDIENKLKVKEKEKTGLEEAKISYNTNVEKLNVNRGVLDKRNKEIKEKEEEIAKLEGPEGGHGKAKKEYEDEGKKEPINEALVSEKKKLFEEQDKTLNEKKAALAKLRKDTKAYEDENVKKLEDNGETGKLLKENKEKFEQLEKEIADIKKNGGELRLAEAALEKAKDELGDNENTGLRKQLKDGEEKLEKLKKGEKIEVKIEDLKV